MEEPEMELAEEKEAPTSFQEGYCIKITVKPDGFMVSDPEPINETSYESQDSDDSEVIPDKVTMVKHLLHVLSENPIGADAEAQLQEGFAQGPGAMKADAA